MKSPVRILVAVLLAAALGPMLGGCGCRQEVVSRDIRITLDDDVLGKPVQIDFYAATSSELQSWKDVPVDNYFKDNNTMRSANADKATLSFEPGGTDATKAFPADDPKWNVWKQRKGLDLVILAYIPGSQGSWTGDVRSDPRRQVVPLNGCLWDDPTQPILIRVRSQSVVVESQFRTTAR